MKIVSSCIREIMCASICPRASLRKCFSVPWNSLNMVVVMVMSKETLGFRYLGSWFANPFCMMNIQIQTHKENGFDSVPIIKILLSAPNPSFCLLSSKSSVLELGFMATVHLRFSYLIQCKYFLSYLSCRNHSTGFWISLIGNWSMCTFIVNVSMGGEKFRNLLCHHLGDINHKGDILCFEEE